jgi:hypothetical protein
MSQAQLIRGLCAHRVGGARTITTVPGVVSDIDLPSIDFGTPGAALEVPPGIHPAHNITRQDVGGCPNRRRPVHHLGGQSVALQLAVAVSQLRSSSVGLLAKPSVMKSTPLTEYTGVSLSLILISLQKATLVPVDILYRVVCPG